MNQWLCSILSHVTLRKSPQFSHNKDANSPFEADDKTAPGRAARTRLLSVLSAVVASFSTMAAVIDQLIRNVNHKDPNGKVAVGTTLAVEPGLTHDEYILLPDSIAGLNAGMEFFDEVRDAYFITTAWEDGSPVVGWNPTPYVAQQAAVGRVHGYLHYTIANNQVVGHQALNEPYDVFNIDAQIMREIIFLNRAVLTLPVNTQVPDDRMVNIALAARLYLIMRGWIGGEVRVVAAPTAAGGGAIGAAEVPDPLLSEITGHLAIAANFIGAAVISYFQTNHHIGQGDFSPPMEKVAKAAGFQKGNRGWSKVLMTTIYRGVHAVNTRLLLAMATPTGIVGRYDRRLGDPHVYSPDIAYMLRHLSAPAGTSRVTNAWTGLRMLRTARVIFALPSRTQLAALEAMNTLVEQNNWRAHCSAGWIGRWTLAQGVMQAQAVHIVQRSAAFDSVVSEICRGVLILSATSSLAESAVVAKAAEECQDQAWITYLTRLNARIKGGLTNTAQDRVLSISNTGTGVDRWASLIDDPVVVAHGPNRDVIAAVWTLANNYYPTAAPVAERVDADRIGDPPTEAAPPSQAVVAFRARLRAELPDYVA